MNAAPIATLFALGALASVSACVSGPAGASVENAPEITAARPLIVDDFEAARAEAARTGRPLLVNFTGHTCVNCRMMEVEIFEHPTVAATLDGFVEARLHSDAQDPRARARNAELVDSIAKSLAQPTYVVLDPATGRELGRLEGATLGDPEPFRSMLERSAAAL